MLRDLRGSQRFFPALLWFWVICFSSSQHQGTGVEMEGEPKMSRVSVELKAHTAALNYFSLFFPFLSTSLLSSSKQTHRQDLFPAAKGGLEAIPKWQRGKGMDFVTLVGRREHEGHLQLGWGHPQLLQPSEQGNHWFMGLLPCKAARAQPFGLPP